VQDEVNQDYSEQNEVDGMKKGADGCMYALVPTFYLCTLVHGVWCIKYTIPGV